MENKGSVSAKQILIALLAGAVAFGVGTLTPTLAMVCPAFIAPLYAAWGLIPALIAAAVSGAGLLIYFGAAGGLSVILLYVPASFIIGYILKKQLAYRSAVKWSAGAIAVGVYLMLCLPSILAGLDPFEGMRQALIATRDGVGAMLTSAGVGEEAAAGVMRVFANIDSVAASTAVGMTVCFGLCFGFFDVVIARAILKKANYPLRAMMPMPLWQLSKSYSYMSLAMLLGALGALLLKLENAEAVLTAAECIVFAPLMLMGFCLVEFSRRMSPRKGRFWQVFFYAGIVLFIPYSLILLAILGLIDRVTRSRRKYAPKGK